MRTVFRVQGPDGRGPWRPGLSALWSDNAPPPVGCLPMFEEFGVSILAKIPAGAHCGCACATEKQLRRWFSSTELERLAALQHFPVRIEVDGVVAESENQLVFWRKKPLALDAVRL